MARAGIVGRLAGTADLVALDDPADRGKNFVHGRFTRYVALCHVAFQYPSLLKSIAPLLRAKRFAAKICQYDPR